MKKNGCSGRLAGKKSRIELELVLDMMGPGYLKQCSHLKMLHTKLEVSPKDCRRKTIQAYVGCFNVLSFDSQLNIYNILKMLYLAV